MSSTRHNERNSHGNNSSSGLHRNPNEEQSFSKVSKHHSAGGVSHGHSAAYGSCSKSVSIEAAKSKRDPGFSDKLFAQKEEKTVSDQDKVKLRRFGDWSEQLSKAGKKYFYNCKTEVSQWEKPQEWTDYEQKYSSSEKQMKAVGEETRWNDSVHSTSAKLSGLIEPTSKEDLSSNTHVHNRKCAKTNYKSSQKPQDSEKIVPRLSTQDTEDVLDKVHFGICHEQHNSSSDRSCQSDHSVDYLGAKRERSLECQYSQPLDEPLLKKQKLMEVDCSNEDSKIGRVEEEEEVMIGMQGSSEIDLDRLPRLLVEIAERHDIDLADSCALEKIKEHLKAALSTDLNSQPDFKQLQNLVSLDCKSTELTEANVDTQQLLHIVEENEAEVDVPLATLSELHKLFYNDTLTTHLHNWSAIHFENQVKHLAKYATINLIVLMRSCNGVVCADHMLDRSINISLNIAQMSSDLKCARSLVRTAEIKSTLLEQRVNYLRQQYRQLDSNNTSNKSTSSNNLYLLFMQRKFSNLSRSTMINAFVDASSDDSDNELMDVVDMEHYRLQLERLFMHHRALQREPVLHPQLQSLKDHNCVYCDSRFLYLATNQQSRFKCSSLKQSIVLNFGRSLYDSTCPMSLLAAYPLPQQLKANIRQVVDEMKAWLAENERFEENRSPSLFKCFLRDVHWLHMGGTFQTIGIDRVETAKMILHACRVFPFAGNVLRSFACEFLLAASNCLDEEVIRLWPLIDLRIREQWLGTEVLYSNPVISYWVAKCAMHTHNLARSLERVLIYCTEKDNSDLLRYFWPKVTDVLSAKMPYIFDHTFHLAIEKGNRPVMYFLWKESLVANRASMISSVNCCGTRNAYHAFVAAVSKGCFDIVEFLWNNTSDDQHNGMLLADHSAAFCAAAAKGFHQIVDLLWSKSTKNQRFVLLYEGNCAAFRDACTEGHLEVVKILWPSVDDQQRAQLLTVGQNMSFVSACQHGHLNILEYLFANINQNTKRFLVDTILPRAISIAVFHCKTAVFVFLKSILSPSQFKRALFFEDLTPVKNMLSNWCNSQQLLPLASIQQFSSCSSSSSVPTIFVGNENADLKETPTSILNHDNFWYHEVVAFVNSLKNQQELELILPHLPHWFSSKFLVMDPLIVFQLRVEGTCGKKLDTNDVHMTDDADEDEFQSISSSNSWGHSTAEASDDETFFESWLF